MSAKIQNENGSIIIQDDVIALVAGNATVENYGVIGMVSKTAGDGIWQLLGRENLRRGVSVSGEDDGVIIDLYLMVQYGVSLIAVAENIIHNVSYQVQNSTGLTVKCVNVHVEGVRVQGE